MWRASGFDVLDLDSDGAGVEPGVAVFMSYEDSAARIKTKIQRVVQRCYRRVKAECPNAGKNCFPCLSVTIQVPSQCP
jgi:hypothetical protein